MIRISDSAEIESIIPYVVLDIPIKKGKDSNASNTKGIILSDVLKNPPSPLENKVIEGSQEEKRIESIVSSPLTASRKQKKVNPAYEATRNPLPDEFFRVSFIEAEEQKEQVYYESVREKFPSEMYSRYSTGEKSYTDYYTTEFKQWWYPKYRTVGQNLRNITFLRGIMGRLEKMGATVVKKVK
jgi:hypothetical protein